MLTILARLANTVKSTEALLTTLTHVRQEPTEMQLRLLIAMTSAKFVRQENSARFTDSLRIQQAIQLIIVKRDISARMKTMAAGRQGPTVTATCLALITVTTRILVVFVQSEVIALRQWLNQNRARKTSSARTKVLGIPTCHCKVEITTAQRDTTARAEQSQTRRTIDLMKSRANSARSARTENTAKKENRQLAVRIISTILKRVFLNLLNAVNVNQEKYAQAVSLIQIVLVENTALAL
jgi:hypothetical protein